MSEKTNDDDSFKILFLVLTPHFFLKRIALKSVGRNKGTFEKFKETKGKALRQQHDPVRLSPSLKLEGQPAALEKESALSGRNYIVFIFDNFLDVFNLRFFDFFN